MSLAAAEVRCRDNVVPSNIPGAFKCDVSFDATLHRRGDYSNQGFGAAIDVVSNKVLIISCTNACAENAYLGHKKT